MRVLSLESRRAAEMAILIEKNGGVATVAPSMREVPLAENRRRSRSSIAYGRASLSW